MGVLKQVIREAREGRGDMTMLWLDLMNTYGWRVDPHHYKKNKKKQKNAKSLGKIFNGSLKDTDSIQATCANLESWLKAHNRSGLPGNSRPVSISMGSFQESSGPC